MTPGKAFKEHAVKLISSSIYSTNQSVSNLSASERTVARNVKILVPLEALKSEFVTVPISEYSAMSWGFRLKDGSTDEIRQVLGDFLATKCILRAQSDR